MAARNNFVETMYFVTKVARKKLKKKKKCTETCNLSIHLKTHLFTSPPTLSRRYVPSLAAFAEGCMTEEWPFCAIAAESLAPETKLLLLDWEDDSATENNVSMVPRSPISERIYISSSCTVFLNLLNNSLIWWDWPTCSAYRSEKHEQNKTKTTILPLQMNLITVARVNIKKKKKKRKVKFHVKCKNRKNIFLLMKLAERFLT